MTGKTVAPAFFTQPTLQLARALLGMELVHQTPQGITGGMIVEVEAYRGPSDKAAHSYGGKITERTRAMFGPAGHAYVYFVYGMHYCMNVVSGPEGVPEAVLIRALQPTEGIELMAKRRGLLSDEENSNLRSLPRRRLKTLTSGPARLCQAMGIDKNQYGMNLIESPLFLRHFQDPLSAKQIEKGPRINIDYAEEAKDFPWRFWIKDNPFVSK